MATDTKKKRKKKKPPTKAKPKTNQFGVTHQVSSTKITVADEGEVDRHLWLRRLAELTYVTSQAAITINTLAQDPQFKGKVAVSTLRDWCTEDRWVEKRQKYYMNLEEEIKKKVANAQLQSRFKQLRKLDKLSDQMHTKLEENDAEPGTFEGMVGGLVKVETMREEIRSKISTEMIPENLANIAGVEGPLVTPKLSEAEAREAALAVIRKRQAEAKKKKEVTTEDD